ncbi:MAG: sigma-70 family RNA polymerase sigma factor [Nannocystaceae bacterium]
MDAAEDEDMALVRAWREGDRAAGQRLFGRYYEPVARFFANKVPDSYASDLIQQTFLACLQGLPGFRADGSFRSYLFAIAYRLLCRHYRARGGDRIDLTEASAVALDPSICGVLVARDEMRLFLAGLREIAIELQVVLELHYWEQCSIVEIAVALEIPEGTVKSRLYRGREALRAAITRLAATPALGSRTVQGMETWAEAVREHLAARPA